jgi:hypothetical protein
VLDTDEHKLDELVAFEMSPEFKTMHIDHRISGYKRIIPDSAHHICMLLRVLLDDNVFCEIVDRFVALSATSPDFVNSIHPEDHGEVCLFWSDAYNYVSLWNRAWCDEFEAYMTMGSDVSYTFLRNGVPSASNIARVTWIASIQKEQLIVLQKMRIIPSTYGPRVRESTEIRILRQAQRLKWKLDDPLKTHCWHIHLLPNDRRDSYRVLKCRAQSQEFIESIVMLQPDFNFYKENEDPTHLFLLEYVI